ncbi:MAG TPA: PDZ domain-containing protein [Myxococcota bacterium]
MADGSEPRPRLTRETRLLIVTLTVSAAVLLLLAQLRFPGTPGLTDAAPAPLDRLAARASYDELASGVARVEASVFPNLVVLQLAAPEEDAPRGLGDVLATRSRGDSLRHVPALRTSSITAVAALGPEARVTGVVGRANQPTGVARVIAVDPLRRLALVNVPQAPPRSVATLSLAALETPAYVVAIEGTSAGITARPIFLGNRERYADPRWDRPLLPLGGSAVTPGALIFSLDGEFIGAAVSDGGTLAIAEAQDVFDTIDQIAGGTGAGPSDAGLVVQALTPALAIATGASTGVVVSEVDPEGAAANLVLPGDVITRIDSQAVTSTEQLLLRIASYGHGDAFTLGLMRDGQATSTQVFLGFGPEPAPVVPAAPAAPFEATAGGVLVRSVDPASTLAEAGVLPGDVVVRVRDADAPSPAALRETLAATSPGDFALIVVRRDGRQRVLAVPGEPPADALE